MNGEIRYKMTIHQKAVFLPVYLIALAERYWLGLFTDTKFIVSAMVFWTMFFAVKTRRSTTLSATGITEWNYRAKPAIPWAAIVGVDVVTAAFTTFVVLHLADGTKKQLRFPQSGPLQRDTQFAEKLATIRSWWQYHTADHYQPRAFTNRPW